MRTRADVRMSLNTGSEKIDNNEDYLYVPGLGEGGVGGVAEVQLLVGGVVVLQALGVQLVLRVDFCHGRLSEVARTEGARLVVVRV